MDLDAAIDAGIISGDATVAKLLSKDSMKYKVLFFIHVVFLKLVVREAEVYIFK